MIDLEYIPKYLKHLKEFHHMPKGADVWFCLYPDGSGSVRTDKGRLASFDTIEDLEIILNNIFTSTGKG